MSGARRTTFSGTTPGKAPWTPSWRQQRGCTLANLGIPGTATPSPSSPLNHKPHRWTPDDDAGAAITIRQDRKNPAGYHLIWNDPAPHRPASPTLQDVFATTSAELQEAKAPQQPDDEMPQSILPSHRTGTPPPRAPHRPHHQNGALPTTPHHPRTLQVSRPPARSVNPQRHAPVG